jgi:hypothetical protein
MQGPVTLYALYVSGPRGYRVYTQGIRPTFLILEDATGFKIEKRSYSADGATYADLSRGFILFQRLVRRHLIVAAAQRRIARPYAIRLRETTGLNLFNRLQSYIR